MSIKLIITLFSVVLITGCSSYMDKIYRELDDKSAQKAPTKDKFAYFKKAPSQSKSMNSANYNYMPPKTQRVYKPQEEAIKKRYTVDDLNDNSESTSLWANIDADNHLFTQNNSKQNGDIIVVNVFEELKSRITLELRRAFPDMKKPAPASGASKAPASTPETSTAAPADAGEAKKDEVTNDQDKVFDKISSIVVDQINKDHLLIRGRKNLIYKGQKRTIEIEALVARKSISADDTISSNDILESYVEILR